MDLVASRDEAELARKFGALTSGMSPARRALATRDLLPTARGLRFQTQALEPARAFGMLPVAAVAGQLGASERELLHPRTGRLAPMATLKSSAAPQLRRRELASFPERVRMPKPHRRAERVRRERIVNVFRELAHSARSGRIQTLPGEEGVALRALAEAFRVWFERRLRSRTAQDLIDERLELVLAIRAYLEAYEGRR
jgi:hypothetical protein